MPVSPRPVPRDRSLPQPTAPGLPQAAGVPRQTARPTGGGAGEGVDGPHRVPHSGENNPQVTILLFILFNTNIDTCNPISKCGIN